MRSLSIEVGVQALLPGRAGRACRGARCAARSTRGAARGGRGPRCGRGRARRRRRAAANVAAARSYHEQEPPPATWRTPAERALGDRARSAGARWPVKVGQPTWSSTTVELVALAGEPQHRGDEVRAVRAEQPGGAHDRVRAGRGGRDGALARELGAAVGAERRGRRGLEVRLGARCRRRRSRSRPARRTRPPRPRRPRRGPRRRR